MSYKIKSLTVKNFVVFVDEVTVDFSAITLNQIEAIFKTDTKQSNGAGKSVLLCAISLALFGKGIRSNYISDYIAPTNPTGGIYIGLELVDDSGNILKIERWRRPGSDINKAKVWFNSAHISKDMTISKIDDLVASYAGVTHSNFLSCIFSVMLPGFLALRPAQRFEVLENALAVKKMETIIKKLNTAQKVAEEKLTNTNLALTEKHQLLGQELAKRDIYSQNRDALVRSIASQEEELRGLYKEEEKLIKKRNDYAVLIDLATNKLKTQREKLSSASSEKFSLDSSKSKLVSTINSLAKNFKSVSDAEIECLVCHSTLDKTSEVSIKRHYQSELSDLLGKLAIVETTITTIMEAIERDEKSLALAQKSLSKVVSDMNINSASAMACERTIKSAKESLSIAESSFDTTLLDFLNVDINNLNTQKDALLKETKIVASWKQAMSKNGLRLAYLREEVGTLSAIASKFASSVYSKPTQVEFFINEERDTPQLDFTVNGNGSGTFSTGERRLLEVAITLSLMTLLKSAGMNLEFLILDEALDGLSETSKHNVLSIIGELSKEYQVIMISHDDMIKKTSGNIIRVIKDDATKTSTIEQYVR